MTEEDDTVTIGGKTWYRPAAVEWIIKEKDKEIHNCKVIEDRREKEIVELKGRIEKGILACIQHTNRMRNLEDEVIWAYFKLASERESKETERKGGNER